MAGILLLGATAFPFNGGRTQAAGQPSGGDFPFVDHFKNCQGWSSSGVWLDPTTLDANGWPTSLPAALSAKMYIPSQAQRAGKYIIDWQGNGTITLNSGATLFSGSLTSSGGSGTATVTPTGGSVNNLTIGISALGSPPISDIRVYHESDAGIIDTQIFAPAFLTMLRTARYGVIRFLDNGPSAAYSGQGNVTTWDTRKPLTYAFWAAAEPRASMAMGTASYALNGSSNDYSKTYGDGVSGPTDRETIMLKVANSATNSTCTFNKNGTGALPILSPSGGALSSGQRPTSTASPIMTLVYDAGFNSWIKFGGDSNTGSVYLNNGHPIEVCMELCKIVGAHPFFPMPYLSMDATGGCTDFPASLASYIKTNYQDTVCTWMVPRFEGPNETWNNQFSQTAYADNRQIVRNGSVGALSATAFSYTGTGTSGTSTITATGASAFQLYANIFVGGTWTGLTGWTGNNVYVIELNVGGDPNTIKVNRAPTSGTWVSGGTIQSGTSDRHNWIGRVGSYLGQAIAGVWGVAKANVHDVATATTKYQTLVGVQSSGTPSGQNNRLSAPQLVAEGGDSAADWTTTVTNAQYSAPVQRGRPEEVGLAWLYNQGTTSAAGTYVDGLTGSSSVASSLGFLLTQYGGWKTWAQGFSINRMCGYEGGYSPDYLTSSATVSCTITGATKDATGCTLTVSNGSIDPGWVTAATNSNGCFDSNCVGLTFTIASVAGMTQLNGLTATIVSVTGNQIKTDIDSSVFSTYTSGGVATVVSGRNLINALRYASKKHANLAGHTTTNLTNYVGLSDGSFTAEFPSSFLWSGSSFATDISSPGVAGDGQVWPVLDPDIYDTNSPEFDALKVF